jgi:hypothetical protein
MLRNSLRALAGFAAVSISLFGTQPFASADDDDHFRGDDDERFRGVANFEQGLVLVATSNAPAGAKGKADFIAVNDHGTNYEMLFVKTIGLTNGVYSVHLADATRTNIFDLGALNVVTKTNLLRLCGTHSEEDDQGENENEDGDNNMQGSGTMGAHWLPWGGSSNAPSVGWTSWVHECAHQDWNWLNLLNLNGNTNLCTFATNAFCWYTNTLTVGAGSFLLPSGLSQTNATVLSVTDTNGVAVLTGDFSTTTNSVVIFKEIVDVVPGTATNAHGTATITYRMAKSKSVGTFKLEATGLPPKQKLFLTADGKRTIKVVSSKTGTLHIRSFPHLNIATVQSIVATDTLSNVVFTIHF